MLSLTPPFLSITPYTFPSQRARRSRDSSDCRRRESCRRACQGLTRGGSERRLRRIYRPTRRSFAEPDVRRAALTKPAMYSKLVYKNFRSLFFSSNGSRSRELRNIGMLLVKPALHKNDRALAGSAKFVCDIWQWRGGSVYLLRRGSIGTPGGGIEDQDSPCQLFPAKSFSMCVTARRCDSSACAYRGSVKCLRLNTSTVALFASWRLLTTNHVAAPRPPIANTPRAVCLVESKDMAAFTNRTINLFSGQNTQ